MSDLPESTLCPSLSLSFTIELIANETDSFKVGCDITDELTVCTGYTGRQANIGSDMAGVLGFSFSDRIVHEFMHAIGFWHEQSRPDRDDHVTINWHNIRDSKHRQFVKVHIDQANMVGPYDICSVMHYGEAFFRKDYIPMVHSTQ